MRRAVLALVGILLTCSGFALGWIAHPEHPHAIAGDEVEATACATGLTMALDMDAPLDETYRLVHADTLRKLADRLPAGRIKTATEDLAGTVGFTVGTNDEDIASSLGHLREACDKRFAT